MALDVQALVDKNPGARGIAVVITNDYDNCPDKRWWPLPCHKDGEQMSTTFKDEFGFAFLWKKNATAEEIKALATQTANCDYPESYKFVVFAYSGHGEIGPLLVANDGNKVIVNSDIVDVFEPSRVPKNKHITKLFFFDSCRGKEEMEKAIPKGGERGNYLIAFSTIKEYRSVAYPSGSLWMSLVAKRLRENRDSVQNILAEVFVECKETYHMQCPETINRCGIVRLYNEGEPVVHVH